MPGAKARPDSDDAPLKRLGGGRWQTRDERFTIEPQSGTWAVVDAEQTDDLGMPLVRGPYRSLTDAKAAISTARTSAPAESPLTDRLERRRTEPPAKPAKKGPPARSATKQAEAARRPPDEPREPAWLTDLEATERGRARRQIARLEEAGAVDAASIVRRDILGDVAAVAAIAIGARLADLGADASPDEVAELLTDGRDDGLGVRWRLVDGAGRPINLDLAKRRRG